MTRHAVACGLLLACGLFHATLGAAPASAQELSGWVGYARSQFDWPGRSQASAIPVGVRLTTGGSLQLGLEAATNELLPFRYELLGETGEEVYAEDVVQRSAAAVILLDVAPESPLSLYLRGGYGAYQTRVRTATEGSEERELSSSTVWAPSGAVGIRAGVLLLEGAYHMTEVEPRSGAGERKTHTFELRAGFILR